VFYFDLAVEDPGGAPAVIVYCVTLNKCPLRVNKSKNIASE